MQYQQQWVEGRFLARPNRFVALVDFGDGPQRCHVKNTGRCRELLTPGARVWCLRHQDPSRKTAFSLIAAEKSGLLINLDSQAPNAAAMEWAAAGGLGFVPELLRREVSFGDSRFDLYYETEGRRGFVEVKGVTLEQDGVCRFPDAPTARGVKHLRGLRAAVAQGYEATVLFVIQMQPVRYFVPNGVTDPAFAAALREAAGGGVQVLAVDCQVTPGAMTIRSPVEVRLEE